MGPSSFPAPSAASVGDRFKKREFLAACSRFLAASARIQNARGPTRARLRRLEGHPRYRKMHPSDDDVSLILVDTGGDNILAFHAIDAIPIRKKASTCWRASHAVVRIVFQRPTCRSTHSPKMILRVCLFALQVETSHPASMPPSP